MHKLAKFCLWSLTAIVPVFIAACYGPSQRYTRAGRPQRALSGRVVEQGSGQALAGIAIHCLRAGQIDLIGTSAADGSFTLFDPNACDELVFEDIDGEGNGGLYVQRTIDFCEECPDMIVELHK